MSLLIPVVSPSALSIHPLPIWSLLFLSPPAPVHPRYLFYSPFPGRSKHLPLSPPCYFPSLTTFRFLKVDYLLSPMSPPNLLLAIVHTCQFTQQIPDTWLKTLPPFRAVSWKGGGFQFAKCQSNEQGKWRKVKPMIIISKSYKKSVQPTLTPLTLTKEMLKSKGPLQGTGQKAVPEQREHEINICWMKKLKREKKERTVGKAKLWGQVDICTN